MFSSGQMIFALFFVIAFSIIITYMYRKDLKFLKNTYKGVHWILIGFIVFLRVFIVFNRFIFQVFFIVNSLYITKKSFDKKARAAENE